MPVLPAILVQARQARSERQRLPAEGLLRYQEILPQQPRILAGGGPVVLLPRERDCSTRHDGYLQSMEEAERA